MQHFGKAISSVERNTDNLWLHVICVSSFCFYGDSQGTAQTWCGHRLTQPEIVRSRAVTPLPGHNYVLLFDCKFTLHKYAGTERFCRTGILCAVKLHVCFMSSVRLSDGVHFNGCLKAMSVFKLYDHCCMIYCK